MLKRIKKQYKKIINLGVANSFSEVHNKQTKLVNTYVLITLHFSLFFYISNLIAVNKPILAHVITISSFFIKLFVLYFNKKNLFSLAKTVLVIYLFIFINISVLYDNVGMHTEYFFILIPSICLSIYKKNSIPQLVTIISFICFFIPYYFFDIYPANHLTKFRFPIIGALFYSIYAIVNYFKKMNLANEEKLEKAYKELAKTKEFEIAHLQLKSIRAQMNPHFMFNAMNSIQNLVLKGDKYEAYEYLTKFTSLIRENLNMSEKNFVSLDEELSLLKKYLELEKLRFRDDFEYEIIGEYEIEDIKIPSMIIQPFIENSVKHGLLHKTDGIKKLKIILSLDTVFTCTVIDNGIGIKASKLINEANQEKSTSFSTTAIQDRLSVLARYYNKNIGVVYEDIAIGTKVIIKIPFTYFDEN